MIMYIFSALDSKFAFLLIDCLQYGVLDSQQLQLLECEQDELSSDFQDGVGMQQDEVSAAMKQSSHLHSCLSSFNCNCSR